MLYKFKSKILFLVPESFLIIDKPCVPLDDSHYSAGYNRAEKFCRA